MAKKLTVPSVVTIYSPKGKPEEHTRANARDLVNGAGYTWEKKKPANPAAYAPFALPQNTKFSKSKAQEILDRVGAPTTGEDDEEEVFDGVDDGSVQNGPISLPSDEEDAEEEVEEEVEEAPAAPAKKPRKPKQPKPAPAPEPEEVEGIEEA